MFRDYCASERQGWKEPNTAKPPRGFRKSVAPLSK